MPDTAGKRLVVKARELSATGPATLDQLPTPEELAKRPAQARHGLLEGLRVELYAISSILADGALTHARRQRPAAPPYGLVLSRHTELRMIIANPAPATAGSIDSFHALGKAFVDTTVFHLHRYLSDVQAGDQRWLFVRLEELLKLFCVGAGPATRSRMRDGVSFVYGGLHFGTGVTVQLAEVMASMLGGLDLEPAMKAEILARSGSPALHLATLSFPEVIRAYQQLQSSTRRTTSGTATQGWMEPERFVVRESEGRPWRIDLRDEERVGAAPAPRPGGPAKPARGPVDDSFATQGCPARISPSGAISPIATLWSWCIELAHDTGLLGVPSKP